MTTDVLTQLRACGVTIAPGEEPGTVRLALSGPLPAALRAAVRDRAALRDALDQEVAAAAELFRARRTGRQVLRHAAAMLEEPPSGAPGTRRERRRARQMAPLATDPSRALYWAIARRAQRDDADAALPVAELVHCAVLRELEARYPGQPVEGALVRLGDAEGPGALRELFRAAADRLLAPAAGS